MKIFYAFIVCCLVFLGATNVVAQTCDQEKRTTSIYYGNGVGFWEDISCSMVSTYAVQAAYLDEYNSMFSHQEFYFLPAYNKSRGFDEDLLEVFDQKIQEDPRGITAEGMLDLLQVGTDTAALVLKRVLIASGAGAEFALFVDLMDRLDDIYIDILKKKASNDDLFRVETEKSHKDRYISDLKQGKRVIVIAHSQGNLFANYAVEQVIAEDDRFKDSIGIVGVASPADDILYDNEYVTARDDSVIDVLRLFYPNVLKGNIDNDPGVWNDHRDSMNHFFKQSYFAEGLLSRERIDQMLLKLLFELEFPPCGPIVSSVSPSTASLNQQTVFTVSGYNLPETLSFGLNGCEDIETLGGTSTSMQFSCTPKHVGEREGYILTGAVGFSLKDFTVTVSENPASLPVVNSVTPTEAVLDEPTVFTVTGQNLPSTLAFWIADCENLTPLGGTSTSMQVRCTPNWTTGQKDGLVKDEQGGTTLYSFQINVSDEPAPFPVVNSVTPNEAVLDEPTIFTVNGQNLPSTLAFWIDECANVEKVGGDSSTSMMFRCLPSWTTGRKDGVIKDEQGGTTLYSFQVNVVDDNEPVVNSVSPAAVTLGVSTDFTVTGENLPSTLAFFIEECADLQSLGGSSTYMQFRCTPSYTLGIKNGVVKDQPGGTILKEFTVDVADAPSDDDLVLKEVRVTANETLYAGGTATYTATADLAENISTGSLPKPGDVVKSIEVTDECNWLATPTMYATSLGGGLVQAESTAAGQEVKVKCTYYHSPSNLNLTGVLPVIIK